jgi:hypothetical protein
VRVLHNAHGGMEKLTFLGKLPPVALVAAFPQPLPHQHGRPSVHATGGLGWHGPKGGITPTALPSPLATAMEEPATAADNTDSTTSINSDAVAFTALEPATTSPSAPLVSAAPSSPVQSTLPQKHTSKQPFSLSRAVVLAKKKIIPQLDRCLLPSAPPLAKP